jgi:ubiquinone/menaquinone biosynthesis C-methylase UbiE
MSEQLSHDVGQAIAPWDGALYAENTGHHRAHDAWFLERCRFRPGDRVLDIGCGSGDFTTTVAGLVPDGHVVGLDAQRSMVAQAERVALPNQSFVVAAAQALATTFVHDASFDAVITRAVMQWIPLADHGPMLWQVRRLLRPGGWLRADLGGAGNIPHIVPLMDDVAARYGGPSSPWTFPDAGTWMELLADAGFRVGDNDVRTVAQRRPFTRETLLGWFASQAFQAYEVGIDPAHHAAFREGVIDRLDEVRRADGSFDQTYVRLDVLARVPG